MLEKTLLLTECGHTLPAHDIIMEMVGNPVANKYITSEERTHFKTPL
jgi:hypothetical protein